MTQRSRLFRRRCNSMGCRTAPDEAAPARREGRSGGRREGLEGVRMACASGATAVLPPLYADWIGSLLGGPIPAETNATCRNCAMAAPPGELAGAAGYFDPK